MIVSSLAATHGSTGEGDAVATRWNTVVPRRVERATVTILVLAAVVAVAAQVAVGATWVAFFGPLLVLLGVAVASRSLVAGLLVIGLAPVAVWLSRDVPEAAWSMVCFAAFLLAFRGLSVVLVATVLGALNLVSGALVVGTIDVKIDASASIFAFAAVLLAAMGSSVRGNLLYRDAAEQRLRDAENMRAVSVERGVARERLRIARDLHDSIGHQIAVVNMRLGAAEVHLPQGADRSRSDIAAARDAIQAVLRETQQILTVLRSEADAPASHGEVEHSVRALIIGYQDAGMRIEVEASDVTIIESALSQAVRLAAYRIVQEALTNAQRYGQGETSVAVSLDREAGHVCIDIVNTRGGEPRNRGGGNGLVGMRERAASVGGSVEVRPDDNLFWVTARLPVHRTPTEEVP